MLGLVIISGAPQVSKLAAETIANISLSSKARIQTALGRPDRDFLEAFYYLNRLLWDGELAAGVKC